MRIILCVDNNLLVTLVITLMIDNIVICQWEQQQKCFLGQCLCTINTMNRACENRPLGEISHLISYSLVDQDKCYTILSLSRNWTELNCAKDECAQGRCWKDVIPRSCHCGRCQKARDAPAYQSHLQEILWRRRRLKKRDSWEKIK